MHRPRRYCHIGAYKHGRATVCSRGEQPSSRYQVDGARRRHTAVGGVADDVPPGQRGARSLHERELVGTEDRSTYPREPPRHRCAGQLRGHLPRRWSEGVPRPVGRRLPRLPRSHRGSSAPLAWRSCRLSCFIRIDGTLQACAEGWDAEEWRGSPSRSPRQRHGSARLSQWLVIPGRFTAHQLSADRGSARRSRDYPSLTPAAAGDSLGGSARRCWWPRRAPAKRRRAAVLIDGRGWRIAS